MLLHVICREMLIYGTRFGYCTRAQVRARARLVAARRYRVVLAEGVR